MRKKVPEEYQCDLWMVACYMAMGVWLSVLMLVGSPFVLAWALTTPLRWVYWRAIYPMVSRVCGHAVALSRGMRDGTLIWTLASMGQPDAEEPPNRPEGQEI